MEQNQIVFTLRLLLFVLSTTFEASGANPQIVCPKAQLIKPCYCVQPAKHLINVNCFLSPTWLSLKRSLAPLRKLKLPIGVLTVRGVKDADGKPHRIFTGLSMEELIIEDCSFLKSRLPGSIFHKASMLYLTIRLSGLLGVPTRALRPLKELIYLDLTGNNIVEMRNNSLKWVRSTLKYLGISNNSIATFPTTVLSKLPNLEVLDLSINMVTEIPADAFTHNPDLSLLNLNGNLIREIHPDAFRSCPKLKFLGLSENDLNGSVSAFEVLSSLEALEISDVEVDLKDFLSSNATLNSLVLQSSRVLNSHLLSDFVNLKDLDVSDNRNAGENDSFLALNTNVTFHNVIRLDISSSNLFPSKLVSFPNVEEIYSNWNSIEVLKNGDFRYSRHLKVLEMRMCGLRRIEKKVFADTPDLISVNLSFNRLKRLGRQVFRDLRNLREVDISYNPEFGAKFNQPLFIKSCKSLTHLSLAYNEISQLPNKCLQHLTAIKFLNLAGNSIRSVGVELQQNSDLEVLVLRNNMIADINPMAFKTMRQLTDLDLSHNQLQHFHLVYLPNKLESVSLNANHLRTMADSHRNPLCNIRSSIRHLNLSSNRLHNISPRWFFNCAPNLISLDISGNLINCSQKCPTVEFENWASVNRIALTAQTFCGKQQQRSSCAVAKP